MSAHQKYVVWFHEVDKHDIPQVGGKGANLGEMIQAKLPVPPGFIVTSYAYFSFLEKSHLKHKIEKHLEGLDYNDSQQLQHVSHMIQEDIKKAPVPADLAREIIEHYFLLSEGEEENNNSLLHKLKKLAHAHTIPVAVRSSATAEDLPEASFAGQQDTYLNIRGEANLLTSVRAAWASLFNARAMFYRNDHGFDHFKVGIAIPVQKMVSSDASGVMFTIDPVTNDKKRVIIEGIYGLGELIVQGAVTPDHFEVVKDGMKIVDKKINTQHVYLPGVGKREAKVPPAWQHKQKVTDEQVIGLASLGIKLEKHYYFPQDIEWAIEKGKLYIVQTRPITTIKKEGAEIAEKDTIKELKRLTKLVIGSGASPGVVSGPVTIIKSASQIHKIKEGDILVAEQTNPDFVPAMKKAAAIVTAKGGRTSHAAIVSRELGTPAVVGADRALSVLHDKMLVTVDGGEGIVYKGALPKELQTADKTPVSTVTIKTATKVYVNLAEVERAEAVAKLNVDGVGLLRAEFMLAGIGVHPKWVIAEKKQKDYIAKLSEQIAVFCKAFGDRPVVYRTTDFKTNEYKNLKHGASFEGQEENPMLGYRGAARYVGDEEVFELELAAIKTVRQKMGYKNLHVMIPFVRTPEQLLKTKRIMGSVGLLRSPSFKLWMMVEIPVNVISIEDFLEVGIDGVSIGSNDLTQLILGVDRDNEKIAQYFSELNPAVQWALERTIKACHQAKVTCSLCGQAASDYPDLVEKLVHWGITSVSVNADAADKTRLAIAEAEKGKVRK